MGFAASTDRTNKAIGTTPFRENADTTKKAEGIAKALVSRIGHHCEEAPVQCHISASHAPRSAKCRARTRCASRQQPHMRSAGRLHSGGRTICPPAGLPICRRIGKWGPKRPNPTRGHRAGPARLHSGGPQ